jgi:N-acetylglucosaminyldiphosphoundecaprenol N-acetyl-beta-D-mannosaminyltransferase
MAHTDPTAVDKVGANSASPRLEVLGLPVHAVSLEGTLAIVTSAIEKQRHLRIAVMNANKAWLARRDLRLRQFLDVAELVIPEYATVWAAKRLGIRGLHHVGGITLMKRLLEEAPARGWSVFLLGAQPAVVETLRRRLESASPPVRVIGHHHGYLDANSESQLRDTLAATRPDLLFVAMGSPLQEHFLATLEPRSAGVAIGVGGSFDVLAGLKNDAPKWARGRGLEWLYRLAQDPAGLWKRYLVTNSWYVWKIAVSRLSRRGRAGARVR